MAAPWHKMATGYSLTSPTVFYQRFSHSLSICLSLSLSLSMFVLFSFHSPLFFHLIEITLLNQLRPITVELTNNERKLSR